MVVKDGLTVSLGVGYTVLVIVALALVIYDEFFVVRPWIVMCPRCSLPVLLFLIPGTIENLIFILTREGNMSGKAGFYFSLPAWSFVFLYYDSQLIFYVIPILICGVLLFLRTWNYSTLIEAGFRTKILVLSVILISVSIWLILMISMFSPLFQSIMITVEGILGVLLIELEKRNARDRYKEKSITPLQ